MGNQSPPVIKRNGMTQKAQESNIFQINCGGIGTCYYSKTLKYKLSGADYISAILPIFAPSSGKYYAHIISGFFYLYFSLIELHVVATHQTSIFFYFFFLYLFFNSIFIFVCFVLSFCVFFWGSICIYMYLPELLRKSRETRFILFCWVRSKPFLYQ